MSKKKASNGGEVVVEIPSEEAPKPIVELETNGANVSSTNAKGALMESSHALSSNKPPKIPDSGESLARRKSLKRSVYSKPKSRFGEQPFDIDPNMFEESPEILPEQTCPKSPQRKSFNKASPGNKSPSAAVTPKTPAGEYDDQEEIFKKVESSKGKQKRVRAKVLVEWIGVFCILGCLIASLTVDKLQKSQLWGLESWKWCLLITVIFCGLLVTNWFMHIIVFFIERNFLLRKKVLYFVHGLKKSVQFTIWLSVVLLTWAILFDRDNGRVHRSRISRIILDDVTYTLLSLLIGAILWLLKTSLLKILASKFHVNQFFDRIHEAVFHQYVLQTLSGHPLIEEAERVGKSGSTGQLSIRSNKTVKRGKEEKEVIDMGKVHKMKREKVSAWTMKVLVDAVTSSELSTISHTLDESFQGVEGQMNGEITTEMEAIAAAYRIFRNVAQPGSKYIEEDDLRRFMIKEEVDLVLPLFEGSETRQIDKKSLTNWVVKIYQGRKTLAHALNDTKTAVKQLNNLVTGILVIVTTVIWLLLMEITTTKVLVFLGSQLVVAVFMFGNTCKMIFEALVFVFVMHPFDVGDRCVVDGVQMMVEEMNILTTVFLKLNNEKVYYPNSVLATKPIGNYYRSPNMGDVVEFSIDFMTPLERIGSLKDKIKSYLEKNPLHWQPNHSVVVNEIENVNKIKLALYVNHTMNFQDWPEKNRRRTELMIALKKIFEELNIKYNLLPQTVHVCHFESETNCSAHR